MTNWSDPQEIARDNDVFDKLILAFFGLNVWEILVTCDFEWSLITRRRKFRWPLVLSTSTFGLKGCNALQSSSFSADIVSSYPSSGCESPSALSATGAEASSASCPCRFGQRYGTWAGNMTLLSSSTSLMLRTIALWERKPVVVASLGVLCVAHWGVLWRGMFIVESSWNEEIGACYVTKTSPGLLNVTFFYTIAFDLTVLIFTTVALTYKHSARTDLWKLLFQDGLVYFLLTFSSNCIPAVLNVLNLNAIMNVIATIPAACISSILACRCVMRLLEFNTTDVYVHTISGLNSIPGQESLTPYTHTKSHAYSISRPAEVVITTEHYSMAEYAYVVALRHPLWVSFRRVVWN
ncbi:hypothetical protein HDZ31DRAFT_38747 [Schizophyllum fasciatum]